MRTFKVWFFKNISSYLFLYFFRCGKCSIAFLSFGHGVSFSFLDAAIVVNARWVCCCYSWCNCCCCSCSCFWCIETIASNNNTEKCELQFGTFKLSKILLPSDNMTMTTAAASATVRFGWGEGRSLLYSVLVCGYVWLPISWHKTGHHENVPMLATDSTANIGVKCS